MQMARVARGILLSDVGIATTSIEDPARATESRPFGTAWLAVSMEGFETVEQVQIPGDLERIRQFSVISLLNLLRLHLQGLRLSVAELSYQLRWTDKLRNCCYSLTAARLTLNGLSEQWLNDAVL